MKIIGGIILIIAGIVLGLYVGLWVCFIGGIVQIIHQIQSSDIQALQIAIGIVKILFASFLGWVSAIACFIPGVLLIIK